MASAIDTPWGPVSGEDLPSSDRQIHGAILDAAAKCFAANGVAATSMSAVAKEARISRAWLYRNFASRDAIVRAVLARGAQRLTDMLHIIDHPDQTAAGTMTEAFVRIIRTTSILETFLIDRHPIPPVNARIAAETIVRLIISILTTPPTATDFINDHELRSFTNRVIPPLLADE